ncbi:FAD-binding oxidoreductase [Bdellovibrio sp. ZAP7]|uniref:FAD-binding oxidoreductase n=1 Tax=Bdellovibrio sp. ZAP7 TaxID=2231053 RepID=UPI0011588683|nr:FAD-binding oxidoreductase [Bdellovibrio sp. ZAP7]QDK45331.1 FAD-binding oxidoreductase [Bdellovibrio sp. ZAP7]
MRDNQSWGQYPLATDQTLYPFSNRFSLLPKVSASLLPRGLGRSYGDSCLNDHGVLLSSTGLNRYIDFNQETGVLCCEAGVSFDEILQLAVPRGWFLPVTPGTKFITVGGAIANDIHGKNHHIAGNFGHHVSRFEILRSSGERLICSRNENSDLFYATIGGLGLTGFITWVEFNLTKIDSSWIDQEQIQFHSLSEFFEIAAESETGYEYTVAWVDCVSSEKDIRGIFIRGNFAKPQATENYKVHKLTSLKNIPVYFPEITLNKFSIRAFNELYFRKNITPRKKNLVHYEPFFYPLDAIHNWNRIYGKRGFLQYQFVVPYKNDSGAAVQKIIQLLNKSQMGSFLAVLKTFGNVPSEGMMSFPKEGVTLALDFANYGEDLYQVLEECDAIVRSAGGAVYPAKDARMSKESFSAFYPQRKSFEQFIDPQFSSSFWRRVR